MDAGRSTAESFGQRQEPAMTIHAQSTLRSSNSRGRHTFFMTVFGVFLSAAVPAFSQTGDDVAALTRQVDEFIRQGHYADATAVAQHALAAAERQFGSDDQRLIAPINKLAWAYRNQGKYVLAGAMYRTSLAISEEALGPDHLDVATSRETLANIYRIEHRYSDAEQLLSVALATREKVSGSENLGVCLSLYQLAALHETQNDYVGAEPYRRRCLDIREKALGADHVIVGQSLHELARLYRKLGRDDAGPLYSRATAILGPNHPEAILAAIGAGEYENAAHALGVGGSGAGISDAAVQQIRRTFFGQVTDLRWTGYSYTDQMGTGSNVGSRVTTQLQLIGEAVHGNGLWQPFLAIMLPEGGEWKVRSINLLGLAWKQ
jgi:tetratricopeptide (TPR) repeat protein